MSQRTNSARSRIDLTQGPIFKNLILFALPILMGTIVTQLYNIADSVIVGQFVSADALAAVSAGGPVMSIIINAIPSILTMTVVMRSGEW